MSHLSRFFSAPLMITSLIVSTGACDQLDMGHRDFANDIQSLSTEFKDKAQTPTIANAHLIGTPGICYDLRKANGPYTRLSYQTGGTTHALNAIPYTIEAGPCDKYPKGERFNAYWQASDAYKTTLQTLASQIDFFENEYKQRFNANLVTEQSQAATTIYPIYATNP